MTLKFFTVLEFIELEYHGTPYTKHPLETSYFLFIPGIRGTRLSLSYKVSYLDDILLIIINFFGKNTKLTL